MHAIHFSGGGRWQGKIVAVPSLKWRLESLPLGFFKGKYVFLVYLFISPFPLSQAIKASFSRPDCILFHLLQ